MTTQPFHDRDGVIWFDGQLVPWRSATIHVLTHALHYASSVFEGERVYDGRIFKLRQHTERLANGASVMGFEIPYSVDEIDAACNRVVAEQKIADGYVRPIAWRGSEMMGVSAQSSKIHLAIAAWPWPVYFTPEARLEGIRLTWAKWRRPAPDTAPTGTKAAGLYMICTISKHEAENNGYNDALMLDFRGRIAETTGANIFLAQNGVLHTPVPDCFLAGITRATVIELARKRGYQVVERAVFPDDLAKSDEIFITGTAVEVTPVREIAEHKFKVGPITEALLADYDKLVRAPAPAAASAA